ncbi:MAG: Organic hydroperoxide resistance transcriptional regulator [Myxococcales bacterium]|nr:Organic hydroperoxide resistance transcriptional regulator [Myxococcales bacterium]
MSDEVLRLDNQLCFPLYACARLVTQAYRAHLDPLGLTYPQYLVLLVLWERDGQKVSEIGEQLFLDSGTLTPVLKRLEHNGLIIRHRPSTDERAVESRLTAAGRKLKRRAAKVPLSLLCDVGLDLQETARIRDTVRGLIPRLQHAARRQGATVEGRPVRKQKR